MLEGRRASRRRYHVRLVSGSRNESTLPVTEDLEQKPAVFGTIAINVQPSTRLKTANRLRRTQLGGARPVLFSRIQYLVYPVYCALQMELGRSVAGARNRTLHFSAKSCDLTTQL